MQGKRWCFTLNNPSQGEKDLIKSIFESEHCKYGIYGNEVGESGTPHLQGFVIFETNKRLNAVRRLLSTRAHYETAKGNNTQASEYCKKEGDYIEVGTLEGNKQGKRSDLVEFKQWILDAESPVTERDVAEQFPSIYIRYRSSAMAMVRLLSNPPSLVDGTFREWQRRLDERLRGEPDDRSIEFIVDENGGKGKSWFVRYYISKHSDKVQRLSVGKRDDLAYVVDVTKSIFLFDIPRTCMQYLQYSILEQLKDQMVFSPKYESQSKILLHKCHVVVFSNEEPDRTTMSSDRYKVTRLYP